MTKLIAPGYDNLPTTSVEATATPPGLQGTS